MNKTNIQEFLKEYEQTLTVAGVFSAFALAVTVFIPGTIGYYISVSLQLCSLIFFVYFIIQLFKSKIQKLIKFPLGIFLAASVVLFWFHVMFVITTKPIGNDFYLTGMVFLFSVIYSIVFLLGGNTNFNKRLHDLHAAITVICVAFIIILPFLIPIIVVGLIKQRYDNQINLYADTYYPNRRTKPIKQHSDDRGLSFFISKILMTEEIQNK